jgi:hypothetical protein
MLVAVAVDCDKTINYDEALPVVSMRVCNPDCSPLGIHG